MSTREDELVVSNNKWRERAIAAERRAVIAEDKLKSKHVIVSFNFIDPSVRAALESNVFFVEEISFRGTLCIKMHALVR